MDELLIFTHVPKAAGSTLTSFLRTQYARDEVLEVTPIPRPELPERMRSLPAKTRLVYGHATYGLHQHTERPCRYFTMLREPVGRVVSAYRYILANPAHVWHARFHAEGVTLAQFARDHQVDIQTKYLAGFARLKGPAAEQDLAQAMENLEHGFAALGLVERFDESLVLLIQTFGWESRAYVSQNIGQNLRRERAASDEDLAAIRETNQLDQRLYEHAQRLLDTRLAGQPPSFTVRVQELQRRVRWSNRREALLRRVRSLLGRR